MMDKHPSLSYNAENDFDRFLGALQNGEPVEWAWLIAYFRANVIPWIRKKDGRLPANSIVSESYFVEQVFTQSLIRFYELFQSGSFESFGHIRGLMFRIAGIKLKEAYRQHKKDQIIYFSENNSELQDWAKQQNLSDEESNRIEMIQSLKAGLAQLPEIDQQILFKYAHGEKFSQIAEDLGLSEANCRKRKQRAMERLKKIIQKPRKPDEDE